MDHIFLFQVVKQYFSAYNNHHTLHALDNIVHIDRRAFIEYGNSYYSVLIALGDESPLWRVYFIFSDIAAGISIILVNIIIIWCCWTIWDCQWQLVSPAILCVVVGAAMKTMETLSDFNDRGGDISQILVFADTDWALIYILMMLATTLMCTVLIVYRIIDLALRVLVF
ncbi:hypothetical protein IW261DRAFT_1570715 [Armillaria novae-zelandiae]|uniref:Uncharacterized protein n=1 Tax=Armillaria novae-zelandiae TaxID=153914 RepID=A0AA39T915_9AGAR|nr:hypothetical protein IW261DRAFT_1570715 [Armillaria novae-zelandiae]